jgi:sugar phosphate isomerase/epimerase
MFKLAAFSDEISQDLAHACKVIEQFGGTGVEIRGVWDTPVQQLTDAQVTEIKRVVSDHGLSVCSIASPFGKCALDEPDEVAQHMDILRRCADIAKELDCNLIRGFAFWDREQVPEKPWEAMAAAYEPVPAILAEKGVLLGLENEAACYVGTAGHARIFLDRLACERIKAIWDPANHVQDPQSEDVPAFPDGYALIRDDMVHVHVKDAVIEGDGNRPNVFLGEGLCRWPEQLKAFQEDGYEGYISLETHVNPDRFPKHLEEGYGNYLKGEGRGAASMVCLAWLRDTLSTMA